MRTRFLAINYFTSFVPDFLRLPTPRFPCDPVFVNELDLVLLFSRYCSDFQPSLSRQLKGLSIEDSLRMFLADVLPRDIKLGDGDFPDDRCGDDGDGWKICSGSTELLFLEEYENESQYDYSSWNCKSLGSKSLCEAQDRNNKVGDGTNWIPTVILEFEAPKPTQSLHYDNAIEMERTVFFLKASECSDKMEMLQTVPTSLLIHEIQRTLFSVEDIHRIEVEVIPENDYLTPRRCHPGACSIPLFELGEIDAAICSIFSMEDELHSFIENLDTAQGVENNDVAINCQGLSGFKVIDLLDQISNQVPVIVPVTDLSCLSKDSCMENIRVIDLGLLDAASALVDAPVPYEEFEMLDSETFNICYTISNLQISVETETSNGLIPDSMNLKSIDDLIVYKELAPVDGLFKSLPVPVVDDYNKVGSPHESSTSVLMMLETIPISASDEIYLDWDFLGMDKYRSDEQATFQKMLNNVEPHVLLHDMEYTEGSFPLLDLVLSGEGANEQMCTEKKLSMLPGDSGTPIEEDKQELKVACCYPVSSMPTLTMSDFSHLDIFIDTRKSDGILKGSHGVRSLEAGSSLFGTVGKERIQTSASTTINKPKWDIKIHQVILPGNIVELSESFVKSYSAIIHAMNLRGMEMSGLVADGANLLSFQEGKLMEYMIKSMDGKLFLGHGNDNAMGFGALGAIKCMAWFLCLYGIHALYHFFGKLLQGLSCLKPKLSVLQSYIEDAFQLADKEVTKSHPSLALIQELLRRHSDEQSRVLIVADQELWCPLKRILTFLKISVIEERNMSDTSNPGDFSGIKMSGVLHSGCVLISPNQYAHNTLFLARNMSPSILLKKFHTILEYGAQSGSSKVAALLPKLSSSTNIHFLNLQLDGSAALLCTGVDGLLKNSFITHLEKSLCSDTMVEEGNLLSTAAEGDSSSCELHQPAEPCFTDKTVIVNTQDFGTEMIFSRRSTYQRLLALEKEGAQILERDFSIPIDIIINASTCLAWYDCKNIAKKATPSDEASSCVPLCVNNIAANVLTSLSFTFSRCILVFEGESSFLTTIMESSHELYAAAACLGIELQIFFAYSRDLTEEVVLDSIGYVTRSCKGLFLKFPESETLAESFLTNFPSLNPLLALSLLSTEEILADLIDWPEDWKLRALMKFNAADESISLFDALCRYGNREDSVSGLTDCSSSVSSAPKSEGSNCKFNLERRKRKFDESTSRDRVDFKQSKPTNSVEDCFYNTTIARIPRASGKGQLSDQCFNYQSIRYPHESDDLLEMNRPGVSKSHSAWNERLFGPKQKYGATTKNQLDRYDNDMFQVPKDLIGEVVDDCLLAQDFPSHIKAMDVSPIRYKKGEVSSLDFSRSIRNLPFDQGPHPSFSGEVEDLSRSGIYNDFQDLYYDIDQISSKHPKDYSTLGEGMLDQSATSFHGIFNTEKDASYGGSPLRKAIFSNETQQGSPWTIEFLNRIREKAKLRKQSLPNDLSSLHCVYPGTTSNSTKRKSPSAIESFKYKGEKIPIKLGAQKRRK